MSALSREGFDRYDISLCLRLPFISVIYQYVRNGLPFVPLKAVFAVCSSVQPVVSSQDARELINLYPIG